MHCLRYALSNNLVTENGEEYPVRSVRVLHQTEWDASAQEELKLFKQDFWRDEIKQVIQQLEKNPSMAVDILAPIILEGKAVKDSAYCLNHGKVCKLRVARRHIAGTSCVGFSQKGSGLMLADPSIVHTLCWIALRLHCCEADITQENVARCPVDLFSRFMAGVYFIDTVKMDAVQFGIACGRERQFIRFRHRSKIMSEVSPLSSFMKRFFRAVEYSWREHYFINPCADESAGDGIVPNEALEDLLWAASRPSSCAQQLEYDLSSRAAAEQAGNGMSVLVMTVVQMHSLACYHYAKPGRILSSVALASKYQRQMMIEDVARDLSPRNRSPPKEACLPGIQKTMTTEMETETSLKPGLLTGKKPSDPELGCDPYSEDASVEQLFGNLDGGPLVDAVLEFYRAEERTVPFFIKSDQGGEMLRTMQRSTWSRELQEDTVCQYKQRILQEGLSQRALYRAHAECPENFYVKSAIERGLQRVSILDSRTPNSIWSKVISVLNGFHKGAGSNIMDYLQEALRLESHWRADCQKTFLSSSNPRYMELQATFILAKSASSDFSGYFKTWSNYQDALALAHCLDRFQIREPLFKWFNQNVNFLKDGFEALPCLSQMHQLCLIIQGTMRKYYDKQLIGIMIYEALKFCVSSSVEQCSAMQKQGSYFERMANLWRHVK
ncbi:Uncharacterized protein (Fragment) [Durusdinium trenchii]|uniref:Uncharacterized protein n=1 Tax=Durusdinium trenchii TaxID=1381693 RepID=A0ABP0M1E6_9DINO